MNVVVTGGATIAPIDDVRLLTNVSSGRFAAAITEACLQHGARVWHIHARQAELPLVRLARFDLDTRHPERELDRLVHLRNRWLACRDRLALIPLKAGNVIDYSSTLKRLLQSNPIDVVILPMAVSDYEPDPETGKIRSDQETLMVNCRRTPKVIRLVRDWAPSVYLVGFKLLSHVSEETLIRTAASACMTNRADLTVANDLETLRAGRHTVHLVRPGHDTETLSPGADLADRLVARIFDWAAEPRPTPHFTPSPEGPSQ
jgi:phosphopantothenoylcysteine synthetase/decarboxylase